VILGIDHVGLVTDDPAGTAGFMAALGLRRSGAGLAGDYGVACEFWESAEPGRSAVEIVSPVREDSAVAERLQRDGPGIYHVAFITDDLEAEFRRLRGHGFSPVDTSPCRGARPGMRVMFMYLRKPAGLLLELVQYETG
jgi:methylmalonyl-CoA/ethylmalonyl-CoA epimerase